MYSTKTNKETTFIMGSNMGGLISIYAICEYPNVFGAAACLITHWHGIFTVKDNPIPDAFAKFLATYCQILKTTKYILIMATKL